MLALVKGLGPGGAERLLVTMATARDHEAYELDVAYLLPWKDHLVGDLERLGVGVRCIGDRHPADPRWLLRHRRLLAQGRYGIVHVHSPVVAVAVRLLARTIAGSRRPKLVSTEHNVWTSHHWLTRWANSCAYPRGDRWLAVSQDVRMSLPKQHQARTQVVLHGVLLDEVRASAGERAAVRSELGVGVGDVVILTVGNLRRTKAYPDLLHAARLVIERFPQVRFVAVGQGPLEKELHDRRDALGLEHRFTFVGYRSDVLRLLAGADVFTLASRYEGYPVAVLEPLAAGLPVVATAVGGVPEAVTSGVDGLLVPPGEPEELAAALLEMIEDPQRREKMGQAALDASGRHDIRGAVERIEAIYDALLC